MVIAKKNIAEIFKAAIIPATIAANVKKPDGGAILPATAFREKIRIKIMIVGIAKIAK